MPLLSPPTFEALQTALAVPDTDGELLPPHFAMRIGWHELARTVAEVRGQLPEDERARVRILTTRFPTAGALDQLGPVGGLQGVGQLALQHG